MTTWNYFQVQFHPKSYNSPWISKGRKHVVNRILQISGENHSSVHWNYFSWGLQRCWTVKHHSWNHSRWKEYACLFLIFFQSSRGMDTCRWDCEGTKRHWLWVQQRQHRNIVSPTLVWNPAESRLEHTCASRCLLFVKFIPKHIKTDVLLCVFGSWERRGNTERCQKTTRTKTKTILPVNQTLSASSFCTRREPTLIIQLKHKQSLRCVGVFSKSRNGR